MRKKVSTFYIQAIGLCCLFVAGPPRSSADEAPRPASAEISIPNMTCKPTPAKQDALPPIQWNDCVGAFTFQNGNSYRGEFRHGVRIGMGVLMIEYIGSSDYEDIGWDEPAIYIGNFARGGRLNGYGLLIGKSGAAYAGMFKDNIAQSDLTQKECQGELSAAWTNCVGTYRFHNGNIYRGEFAHGLPDGIGLLQVEAIGSSDATQVRLPMPGIYVGQFKDGKLSGQGAVVISDAGYFGTFSDNTFKMRTHKSALKGRYPGAVTGD
jgi:hypothetical protein